MDDYGNTAKISAKGKLTTKTPAAFEEIFGGASIVKPLQQYNGIVMPYNPMLNLNYTANYSTQAPLHSNFQYPFYQNSSFDPFTASFVLIIGHNFPNKISTEVNFEAFSCKCP